MYENSYLGLPGEKYRHKSPNELTSVGFRTERWRKEAGLKVADVVAKANDILVRDQRISSDDYWAFVCGQRRVNDVQIRSIAKVLGVTVHVMTHYLPGRVPKDDAAERTRRAPTIKVNEPARRTERKRKAQGQPKAKPKSVPRPYDADEAARLLAKKFGNKVKRNKQSH